MNEVGELELPTHENFQTSLRSILQGAIRVALELLDGQHRGRQQQ